MARLLTSLIIIVVCGFAVWRGTEITAFTVARAHVLGTPAADNIGHWAGIPGVTVIALETELAALPPVNDAAAAQKRGQLLSKLLSVHPLSSLDWLSLAGMRLAAGEPYAVVRQALAMSSLTGPNEGNIMLQRATFGLVLWEEIGQEAQRRTIADLSGALLGTTVRDFDIAPTARALRAKSPETRTQIANLLRLAGVPPHELTRLGL